MKEAKLGQLNLQEPPPLKATRNVDCFQKLKLIGEGTYGQVFMAKEVMTGETVALKKLKTENVKEGFPISAIREIKILQKLNHDNVVKLREVVISQGPDSNAGQATDKEGLLAADKRDHLAADEKNHFDGNIYGGSVYLVFEYMDHDLTGLSNRPGQRFSVPQIKCYMKQLLAGLRYCHSNDLVHRDIKGPNLLLDNNGSLKLADFGLARSLSDDYKGDLTNRVITLPYRPPELLFGATKYGPAVDIWSAGCIFAELLHGNRIMSGKSEPEQLRKIFDLCGSPDENSWPGVSKMPWYNYFKPSIAKRRRLREVFRHFDPDALDLLDRMLTLDPCKRISAAEALDAKYFKKEPLPDPKSLPKYESSHELPTRQRREQQLLKEEHARSRGLPYPPSFSRLPPIQHGGQVSEERLPVRKYSINQQPQQSFPPGGSNPNNSSRADAGPSMYSSNSNLAEGYNRMHCAQNGGSSARQYPSQGRSDLDDASTNQSTSSFADAPPGFSQRGPNRNSDNRNWHHGWQR